MENTNQPEYVPLEQTLASFRTQRFLVVSAQGQISIFRDGVPGVWLGKEVATDDFTMELIRHIFLLEDQIDTMEDEIMGLEEELDNSIGFSSNDDDEPWKER